MFEKLEYRDGKLFWKVSPKYDIPAGSEAGCLTTGGYTEVGYAGKHYLRHRIIYFMHTGDWPKLIDHVDTNPSNDHIDNLRPSNKSLNGHNSNKSRGIVPFRGVSLGKNANTFAAYLKFNRKRKFLGYFKSAEEASHAYETYRKEVVSYVR